MASSTSYSTKGALTLSNSIIGVSILAMPFCMKTCGIVLGIVLLIGSALLTRFTCHLLLKSAVISRRKTFEFIAFQTFGSTGKLMAELNIIGFMLGLLISFFVVFGDLGTAIISEILNLEPSDTLRTFTLVVLGFGIALPVAMLKELDILSKISTLSVIFYIVLALKIILEAVPVLITGHWKTKVTLWEPSGVLQCLPIFALALSCQTQLFTICDSLPDSSVKTMNSVVKLAVYLCTGLYMIVGLFGYIGGCEKDISGNILVNFSPGFFTELIKLCFVLSVALSFPLVVIPCRTSIYSLLFKKSTGPFDVGASLMPELRFKVITFVIVFSTFVVGLLCPSIEIVLGFVGSTIGVLICIIFPAIMFVRLTPKNTFEKRGAQVALVIGVVLLVTCTWMHVQTVNPYNPIEATVDLNEESLPDLIVENDVFQDTMINYGISTSIPVSTKMSQESKNGNPEAKNLRNSIKSEDDAGVKRQEPPIPESPDIKPGVVKAKEGELNLESIQKTDKAPNTVNKENEVLQKLENEEKKAVLEQVEIIKKLEAHQEVEKKLLEERRQLLAEIINHKKVHEIANEPEEGNNDKGDQREIPVNSYTKLIETVSNDKKREVPVVNSPDEKVRDGQFAVQDVSEVVNSDPHKDSVPRINNESANRKGKEQLPSDLRLEQSAHPVLSPSDRKDQKNENVSYPLTDTKISKDNRVDDIGERSPNLKTEKNVLASNTGSVNADQTARGAERADVLQVDAGQSRLEVDSKLDKQVVNKDHINNPDGQVLPRADNSLLR